MNGSRWCVVLLLIVVCGCDSPSPTSEGIPIGEALGEGNSEGFARATEVRTFRFPRDHGPHPAFRNEWWYITGNLKSREGRRFGFQATFFRSGLRPSVAPSPSAWRTNQIWMAHAALTDLKRVVHLSDERFARQGAGLAGAAVGPVRVWLENWQLEQAQGERRWQLQLPAEDFELDLTLEQSAPIVLQGNQGLSQKSATPGNASYYYSIPRMQVSGRITQGDREHAVTGLAWFDREWSTSALSTDQEGWDWFSLHIRDGRNLMFYRLRTKGGGNDPNSGGSVSDGSGLVQTLGPESLSLTPLRYWTSEGRHYPIEWRLQLQGEPSPWIVKAILEDQEMALSVHYWEGAVDVIDERSSNLLGSGYLEMTGYQ